MSNDASNLEGARTHELRPRILVTFGSKRGGTAEIASRIADVLRTTTSVPLPCHDDGAARMANDLLGHRTEQHASDARPAAAAHHDEVERAVSLERLGRPRREIDRTVDSLDRYATRVCNDSARSKPRGSGRSGTALPRPQMMRALLTALEHRMHSEVA